LRFICPMIGEVVEKWSVRRRLLSKFNLFKRGFSSTVFWGKVSSGFDHSSVGFGMIPSTCLVLGTKKRTETHYR